uniref:E74-like ETS transcription factor 3 isoform 9 n=1 Tax=Homo sapiens TaxID=9606 RepID=A0A8E8V2S2_HUMAN|nr:E74-like ETS transcription factor 3 isoform 9 [Homo sapiens]
MAATCEISNIFSNYFSAMYSSEDSTLASVPPAATFGADDLVLTLSNPQMSLEGTEKASWLGEQPQFWSKTQVLDWISYQVEKNKYDASAIDFSRCDMDGATLCNCALEELRLVFGPLGDQLHAQLRDLTSSSSDELSWIIELLEKDGMAFQEALDPGPFAPRGTHLWEFIRDILIHPELNEGLMKWENRHEGVFKFLRSEAVAQLWGQKKKNSNMTYEKLSRAMRYYYKREILERVDGRRLVYKFGKNSSGWKEEEVLQSRN